MSDKIYRGGNVHFTECEHAGDLDNYRSDLLASGAEVVRASLADCEDCEEGVIFIKVLKTEWDAFMAKFRQTDSFAFSSLDTY